MQFVPPSSVKIQRMQMEIARASFMDITNIHRLEQVCFGEDAWSLLDLTFVLSVPKGIRYKVLADDVFAGFASAENQPKDGFGWLTTIGIFPEYRGQGLASALIAACERQITQPVMRLSVRTTNADAIQLYKKLGYTEVEIWKKYYTSGSDALVMEKKL